MAEDIVVAVSLFAYFVLLMAIRHHAKKHGKDRSG